MFRCPDLPISHRSKAAFCKVVAIGCGPKQPPKPHALLQPMLKELQTLRDAGEQAYYYCGFLGNRKFSTAFYQKTINYIGAM